MKYLFPLLSLALCLPVISFAQTEPLPLTLTQRLDEALLFSNQRALGSARFMGTGGSMTPIGVDATTLHTNPAGIGWNRNGMVSLGIGYMNRGVDATLRGNAANETTPRSQTTIIVPNASLLYAGAPPSPRWPTLNYGLSVTNLANFNEAISYSGYSQRSVIDALVEDFESGFVDPFRSGLVLQIDPDIGPTSQDVNDDTRPIRYDGDGYYSEFDLLEHIDSEIFREGTVERSGGMNELALGLGGNYENTLMWGVSLGIPIIEYEEERVYSEVDVNDEIYDFDDADYNTTKTIEGAGANFKFGLVYLPSIASRVSLSVHSPTFWTVDETYQTTFSYNYTVDREALGGNAASDILLRETNVRTPWRFNLGGAYLVGRTGFISADVEYVNYKGTEFGTADFAEYEDVVNDNIDFVLKSSVHAKVGGEINLDPVQVRLGVGYRTLPIKDARFGQDEGFLDFSGGLGYKMGKFFIDVAARYEGATDYFAPYRMFGDQGLSPNIVDTDRNRITGILTVGYRGF